MNHRRTTTSLALTIALAGLLTPTSARAVTNLATNPGLEDLDMDTFFGDGWGAFGAADFNSFFGANGHISLFGDNAGNEGGAFQAGIPAVEGQVYQFDLLNTRIESMFDARLRIGLEFYAADDTTQLGEQLVEADTAERLLLPNVDTGGAANGAVFSTRATAPVGASFVRPIVRFDEVNPLYLLQSQANLFVFDTFLSEVPAPGGNLLKNPGFGVDVNADGALGDVWGSFGNTGFNEFFGANTHASLFADTAGNEGGFFQQSILAEDGATYRFTLEDVRVEANFDADLTFGLEYYGGDDFTKLGETIATADTSTTGDGLSFTMTGAPVAGTVFVRPIFSFGNVNATYLAESQASAFVFETSLAVAADIPGDFDGDGDVDVDDFGVFVNSFQLSPQGGPPFADGDFDEDGDVDVDDFGVFVNSFQMFPPTGPPSAVAVPEPTTLVVVTLGLGVAGFRRTA